MRVHDFSERLTFSENARNEAFWGEVYAQAFPDMVSIHLNDRDNGAQRCGVDRVVVLKSTKALTIDEKVREKDYGDVLLEIVSNDRTGAPGWIEKDLTVDFLAYGVLPTRTAWLFPWEMLRLAWVRHGGDWKASAKRRDPGFRVVRAANSTYSTWSVALPMGALVDAVSDVMIVRLRGAA